MALINCPDCNSQVSDRAEACIKCGSPIAGRQEAMKIGTPLTTTQSTSKRLKMHSLLSGLSFIIGMLMAMGSPPGSNGAAMGVFICLVGLVWFMVTRIRIWWHHG